MIRPRTIVFSSSSDAPIEDYHNPAIIVDGTVEVGYVYLSLSDIGNPVFAAADITPDEAVDLANELLQQAQITRAATQSLTPRQAQAAFEAGESL